MVRVGADAAPRSCPRAPVVRLVPDNPTVEPSDFCCAIGEDCNCSMPNLEPLSFLYRDAALVAVAKPSGLAVHRGWSRERVVALTLARDRLGAPVFPVHRLDRATSGALLLALDPEAARRLAAQF